MTLLFHIEDKECPSEYINKAYVIISRGPIEGAVFNYTIDHFSIPLEELRDQTELYRKEFLERKDFASFHHSLNANFCYFYLHTCIEAYKWFYTYKVIKDKFTFDKIIISDGVKQYYYTPFYGAEGEINEKLFYKTYDFIPGILFQFLKKEGKDVRILNKKSRLAFYSRIFFRRLGLLHLKTGLLFWRSFKRKSNQNAKNIKVLFLSRGLAHTHYILPYIKKYKDSGLLITDGYYSNGANIDYCRKSKIPVIDGEGYLTIKNILKIYFSAIKNILSLSRIKLPDFIFKGMQLNINSVLSEFIISSFDGEIYESILDEFLKNNDSSVDIIITGEMQTVFPFYVNRVAEKRALKCIQLQTTLMTHKPLPKFTFCDAFLFKSIKDKIINEELNSYDASKYEYWGGITDLEQDRKRGVLKNILFYSQPIEKESEKSIINLLIANAKKNELNVFLKPHPRDEEDYINSWKDQLAIISKDTHIDDYIKKIDLVVMRNSSIAQEVILKNTVIVYCLFSERFSKTKSSYIKRTYRGVCNNSDQLITLMNSFSKLENEFGIYRKEVIQDLGLDKDITYFNEKLSKFRQLQ